MKISGGTSITILALKPPIHAPLTPRITRTRGPTQQTEANIAVMTAPAGLKEVSFRSISFLLIHSAQQERLFTSL